jgi:lysophospholipase L1-like esterase
VQPPKTFVLLPDRETGAFGEIAGLVEDQVRTGLVHMVTVNLSGALRAEDHFHFNDRGYAVIAKDFTLAVLRLRQEST